MLAALEVTGNPSSVHGAGRAARRIMEDAREALAARFGGRPADLVFTSGATEANALAIHALGAGRRIIVGATEHDAVRAAAPDAAVLPVDRTGVADLDALAALLRRRDRPALVCLMLANNETGTLQPVAEAAALCRRHGALLHVDAVQAAGRMAVDLPALGADSLAMSSHKLGGPTGAGALLLAREVVAIARADRRWRAGARPARRHPAGARRSPDSPRRRWRPVMPAALAPLRDAAERAAVACGAVVCGGGRGAAAQHHLPGAARRAGGRAGDRTGPGRDRGQRRGGVQLRQGRRQPRAGGDGAGRAGRAGDPGFAAVERDRGGRGGVCRCLPGPGAILPANSRLNEPAVSVSPLPVRVSLGVPPRRVLAVLAGSAMRAGP